jgi:membrane-associated phospholipid phosphatase
MRGRAITPKQLLIDLLPLLVIVAVWQSLRLVPDAFRGPVQSDAVIALERALFGAVPTVSLQAALRRPETISVLDVTMAFGYLGHFVISAVVAFVLWLRDRDAYLRFAFGLMLLSIAAFATQLAVPVAPPRFAGQFGESLAVVDVADLVYRSTGNDALSWAYVNLNGNPVAAMPSLHAAFPVLTFLCLRRAWPRGAWLALVWAGFLWFAIVYLGHHYVVDILAGVAYAVAAYAIVSILLDRRARRDRGAPDGVSGSRRLRGSPL